MGTTSALLLVDITMAIVKELGADMLVFELRGHGLRVYFKDNAEEIHEKLDKGYQDAMAGRTRDATSSCV